MEKKKKKLLTRQQRFGLEKIKWRKFKNKIKFETQTIEISAK
jgi:hypothetical protein